MIIKSDLEILYNWAKENTFPMKVAPTAEGYSNKSISYCWLKSTIKSTMLRKKLIQSQNIQAIYENDDILFSMISSFDSGTVLKPHKDPNVYKKLYKRIQIPLVIPDREKCYMIWKGERIYWKEGEYQIFEVMDYIHEGGNLSDKPMEFLFLDVKKDTIIC